jgi:biopolymer transport protein ExbD
MRLKSPAPNEEPELNVIPLVDVMLLLLIFFMVTTTFVEESRLKITLPTANLEPTTQQAKDRIEIAVTATGEFRVNGKTLLNTSPVTLSAAISRVAGEARDVGITIRADARSTHQSFVTAMEVCGRLGLRDIKIATINEGGRG